MLKARPSRERLSGAFSRDSVLIAGEGERGATEIDKGPSPPPVAGDDVAMLHSSGQCPSAIALRNALRVSSVCKQRHGILAVQN